MATVGRINPQRLASPLIGPHQALFVEDEVTVGNTGVHVDQVLTIDGQFRIVVESRFFSYDFYRRAIAKYQETLGRPAPSR